jgi:oligoribonuclease NrnB/cAMP/cGMP phosphodiesterase (DHH superfamily)
MKNKRASLTIEELRSHAKLIQDGSFDAADLAGGKDNDSATTDPVMEALLVGESSTFMDGTRGNNNNHCNMLMTSYSVLTNEAVEQRQRSTSSTSKKNGILTYITSRDAVTLMYPHREFVRSDSGLETTKISRVERSWLMIAESNRIEEVGEKIFFRYVGDQHRLSKGCQVMSDLIIIHCIRVISECLKITPI